MLKLKKKGDYLMVYRDSKHMASWNQRSGKKTGATKYFYLFYKYVINGRFK